MTPVPVKNPAGLQVSAVQLQFAATTLGLAGTALVIVQAAVWVKHSHASVAALVLTACTPLIAALVFAAVPRRAPESDAVRYYSPRAAMLWITLLLPVALTALAMTLIGTSGSFADYFGLALLVAVNAGRNLRDGLRALWLRKAGYSG
ncbi:MAG: hypothetical protein KGL98_09635 [Gammaproteobacteria bacterium]|nr:hypothetical protein [Gammaproteobacteria bacterium]MBU6510655.1 hypothetical protein [Gammaproteobacteria bacterium]MDE1984319.1 hypothetical protein [Gammaproteobacteria bacterium]MDE2109452.1 hypothetical protein [Gammaproteobacteria bacterium]MDE2461498.1 hypothetical protein [Gammaproteobacteria bacterium]